MSRIRVLGSLNIDLVQQVPRLPALGETLAGTDFAVLVGGKGNNQAAAACLLGGCVEMAGMIGDDLFGERLINQLLKIGVDVQRIRKSQKPSGTATILVLPDGENAIVIAAGANAEVDPAMAEASAADLRAGDFLLCQLEIPLGSVGAAMSKAKRNGATTILDPAPAQSLEPALLENIAILTPNQTEAGMLLGAAAVESIDDARQAAQRLRDRGPGIVIIKLGAEGCFIANSERVQHIPGFRVTPVDTTAAGDCFNGALAVALSERAPLERAARFANAAAALSVTQPGAVQSMPTRAAVEDLLRSA